MSTTGTVHVLGLCGSLRAKSLNRAALRAAGELLPEGMTLETFDLAPIPLYNDDVYQAGAPEPVKVLRDKAAAADAILFCSPEYNYSVSGVLKNAIDWASRPPNVPLLGKPYALMGASPGMLGTGRAQYHLRQIAVFLDMKPVNKPEVLIAAAPSKFDEQGRLTDEPTRKIISDLLAALKAWTLKLRGG